MSHGLLRPHVTSNTGVDMSGGGNLFLYFAMPVDRTCPISTSTGADCFRCCSTFVHVSTLTLWEDFSWWGGRADRNRATKELGKHLDEQNRVTIHISYR